MKPPLTHCPFCNGELERRPFGDTEFSIYICPRLADEYSEFHAKDGSVDYVSFRNPKLLFTIYLNNGPYSMIHGSTIKVGTYIYSRRVLERDGRADPLLILEKNDYDFSDWNKLCDKLSIYVVML